MRVKSLKRKQKWQIHRLAFKKRRLRRRSFFINRVRLKFAKALKLSSQVTNNNHSLKSKLLRGKDIRHAPDAELTKSLISKSINLTNAVSYSDLQSLLNKPRHLVAFSLLNCQDTKIIATHTSIFRQEPLSKKYTLISSIQSNFYNNLVNKPSNQLNNSSFNKNKYTTFTLSRSARKHSMSAWSYNSSKALYDNNKSYAGFTFTDGFVPVLTSSTIHNKEQMLFLPNLNIRDSLFGKYIKSRNLNGRQLPEILVQKAKAVWINKLEIFRSSKHSSKNSRFLRVRRCRKLLRQRNNRVSSTQLSRNPIKYTSHKVTKNRTKYAQTKSNLYRLVNMLRSVLYSTNTYLNKPNQIPSASSLTLPSLRLETLNTFHSYNKQAKALKVSFKSTNLLSTSYNNVFPVINPANRVLRSFRPTLTKDLNFYSDVTPWINDNIIRLVENASGRRSLIQHSMHAENMVDLKSKLEYKKWITRMAYYERNLGHRFFMEEALHIIHLSFRYHDVTLFSSWLKAIITRISFWKTRSIFRFLKYIFNNYYRFIFDSLSIKGIKIRLKGKISAAGNSRKRTILFRSGKNSYSSVNIKCIHDFKTITTFTGVMGFQVWLFY